MSDIFNRLMRLDPCVLEAERFSITPDQARALLRKNGKARKRRAKFELPYQYQPEEPPVAKKKVKPKRKAESPRVAINLTLAQQAAFDNWMEGKKK